MADPNPASTPVDPGVKAKAPVITIKFSDYEFEQEIVKNGIYVTFKAFVLKNNAGDGNREVTFYAGTTYIGHGITKDSGEVVIGHLFPREDNNTVHKIRALVKNPHKEVETTVKLKKITTSSQDPDALDIMQVYYEAPKTIYVKAPAVKQPLSKTSVSSSKALVLYTKPSKWFRVYYTVRMLFMWLKKTFTRKSSSMVKKTTKGSFTVKMRLITDGGYVLRNKNVIILIRKKKIAIATDDDGYVNWKVPVDLIPQKPNEEVEVIITTDGITERASDWLVFPPQINTLNNKVAKVFLVMAAAAWAVALYMGFDTYNEEVLWVATMAWTQFALMYLPWAYKEEVGYALKNAYRTVREKYSRHASDSKVEKILEYIEKHKEHKDKIAAAVGASVANPQNDETFVERVAANMTGEVILEALAGLGKRLLGKKL